MASASLAEVRAPRREIPALKRQKSYVSNEEQQFIRLLRKTPGEDGKRRTLQEIADARALSVSAVVRAISRKKRVSYKPPLTKDQIEQALWLRSKKVRWVDIGDCLKRQPGYIYNTVKRYCEENRLKFR